MGIGKMCLVLCILLISIKKSNGLRFSCISDLHFVTLLLIQCKISLYLGLVRPVWCFVTPDLRWRLHSGAGREFQVDSPATAKLRGPYRSVLVGGTARSGRAAERR